MRPISDALSALVFVKVEILGSEWPLVVAWLVAGGLFFTLTFAFINLRGLPLALELVRGKYDEPDAPGQVTHFQALATALSGTVGIGNIGGVAVAIVAGGPGATFWMVVAGVLGMATKFAECTLGVRYRRLQPDGTVSGGPMYYLEAGLAERGWTRLGKALGVTYAVGIVIGCLGIGNMFQSNQATVQLDTVLSGALQGYGVLVGAVLALLVGAVVLGGIRSIAKVTEKLVPFMALLYIGGALLVIGLNAEAIPGAIERILGEAFTARGVGGGVLGSMVVGFQRAVFSNEAGIGSASIAHAAVKTRLPASEGLVALLEPLVDTVIVCSLTALVITTTAVQDPTFLSMDAQGVALTSEAFARKASWAPVPLALAAVLFAVSTMISWAYYGLKGWTYLFGEALVPRRIFLAVYCSCIVLGAGIQLDAVLDFSDAMVFALCVPNLLGVVLLTPVVRSELDRLLAHIARHRQADA